MSTNEQEQKFDCLAVTHVEVYPFNEGPSMGHMKGLATVVLNDQLHIRGLRIMEGLNGLFVGYPVDGLLPIKDEIGAMISNEISPTINSYLGSTLWNEVYVDGVDTATALEAAQDAIDSDLF